MLHLTLFLIVKLKEEEEEIHRHHCRLYIKKKNYNYLDYYNVELLNYYFLVIVVD